MPGFIILVVAIFFLGVIWTDCQTHNIRPPRAGSNIGVEGIKAIANAFKLNQTVHTIEFFAMAPCMDFYSLLSYSNCSPQPISLLDTLIEIPFSIFSPKIVKEGLVFGSSNICFVVIFGGYLCISFFHSVIHFPHSCKPNSDAYTCMIYMLF